MRDRQADATGSAGGVGVIEMAWSCHIEVPHVCRKPLLLCMQSSCLPTTSPPPPRPKRQSLEW